MLWLALWFPELALSALGLGGDEPRPCAIGDQRQIALCNRAAHALGLTAGMPRPIAEAHAAGLRVLAADAEAERQALERLAGWCLRYTSRVSLEGVDGLLLEIGGSLQLFGGLRSLRQQLIEGLAALGHCPHHGIAPTPRAAWLLARGGDTKPVTERNAIRRAISPLPASLIAADQATQRALDALGLRRIGDCLRLAGDGLASRLGTGSLRLLRQALGDLAEPRLAYHPPARYQARLELPAAATGSEALLFPLQRMLGELCGFLCGINAGLQHVELRLLHEHAPATPLRIGVLATTRSPEQLLEVARERLRCLVLPAAVEAMVLRVQRLQPYDGRQRGLLDGDAADDRLLDRLAARLGSARLHRLSTHADHRPEHAWQRAALHGPIEEHGNPHRPLWLLPAPQALTLSQGTPCCNGPLQLTAGPERLEGGWWEGADHSRDYYVAHNDSGQRLWVYRERRPPHGWFLHGYFS